MPATRIKGENACPRGFNNIRILAGTWMVCIRVVLRVCLLEALLKEFLVSIYRASIHLIECSAF